MDNQQGPPPKIVNLSRFVSGISDFPKEGLDPYVYQDGISIDHRHDPRAITLLPASVKESGSTIIDLPMWASTYPGNLDTYIYGNAGNLYKRTTTPTYSLLHQVPGSHGNGVFYYPEDDYLYYTTDTTIGRYGPISLSGPQFVDNFLQAQGGVPTNTNSLLLVAASSQYANHADATPFDITGDISLGCYINPTSLPTVGNSMTLLAKYDESSTTRAYKLGIGAISGFFGSGTDGSLTISSNTTEAPIDSACTGTAGTQVLTATNSSFVSGQIILIHQTQGTSAGQWQRNTIQGYTAGTITLTTALNGNYTTGAQVRVLKQYTNVTINSGVTYSPKAWNGTVGGILAFLANGTVTVNGTISANGCGFRGGTGVGPVPSQATGNQGEGTAGIGTNTNSANGNGGGAGFTFVNVKNFGAGGAGGGNANAGTDGQSTSDGTGGTGGNAVGTSDLTTMDLGGGGGGGGVPGDNSSVSTAGGTGGGILFINGVTITVSVTGTITANGNTAADTSIGHGGAGGGGTGGSILLKAQTATLGSGLITANAGNGGGAPGNGGNGGAGSVGRININYLTSVTGSTIPSLNQIQDSSLVTTVTYQLQFSVSTNGTNHETLTQNVNIQTGIWQQVAVSWDATNARATFFLNAVSQGTATGTFTSISNNGSAFTVGANNSGSGIANYYDGLMDEAMLLSQQTTAPFWFGALTSQIPVNAAGLAAYYQFNGDLTDATANADNLTGVNTPTFSVSVPFAGATTRLDIDQTATGTGNQYTPPVAISEAASAKISFTPTRDPQKSMQVSIHTVGTGNWTLTIHDSANHLIDSVTVPNASLHTGNYEFTFATPWRPLTNFTNTYHAHFTSTVADGSIDVGTSSNLSTAGYTTFFSFLVTDTQWHPINQMLNQMVIGNERYVGTFNGLPASYNPNTLVLPAKWRVRCFALWNEYLAIGVMRGSSITDFDQGRIYFWDGSALTFNFFIDVPEGGVNALLSKGSTLYAWCGYTGYLFEYQQGLDGDKIKRVPHIAEGDLCEVFPGAVTTWRTLVRYGVGGNVTSSTINRGVYSWGSFLTMGFFQQLYRESLSFDYPISTGNYGSTVSVGLTHPVQNELLIGWKDGTAYGVDMVSFNNAPASYGTISLLVSDDGDVYKQKAATTVLIQHLPLRVGESIQAKYSQDRATYQVSGYNNTVGSTKTSLIITGQLYNEYEIGADLASATVTDTSLSLTPPYERGISFAGLEFAPTVIPGAAATNFFPTVPSDFSYFAKKGFTLVRLAVLWERLQPTLNGALDPTYKSYIDDAITSAKQNNMRVVLDLHNYGRYQIYLDGGITEIFTSAIPNLVYPYADYTQSGSIVLRDYGESFFGTFTNPVASNGYTIAFNMKFNSKDNSFGGEGLQIRPMWQDDNNCYQFNADLADGTWELRKTVLGTVTVLASGSKAWGTTNTYAVLIDVNQGTNGKINVSINGTPLYTTNSVNTDGALVKGKIAFYAPGVHVKLDTMVLNVNGSTSGGGIQINTVGSASVPFTAFANLWQRIATAYANETGIFMYDLMNEWHDMLVPLSPSTYNSTATTTLANQAAITAIRTADINHYIAIESDQYSGMQNFTAQYGSNPSIWWTDPANKTMVSHHYYQDSDHSGTYTGSWSSTLRTRISGDVTPVLSWAQSNNITVFVGEYGVPNGATSDDINWQTDLGTFLGILDSYSAYGTQWAAGASYSSITSSEPTSNYTVDAGQIPTLVAHLGKTNVITTTGNTSPTITGIAIERDTNEGAVKLQTT